MERDNFEGCIICAGKRVVFSFVIGVIRYCVALAGLTIYNFVINGGYYQDSSGLLLAGPILVKHIYKH